MRFEPPRNTDGIVRRLAEHARSGAVTGLGCMQWRKKGPQSRDPLKFRPETLLFLKIQSLVSGGCARDAELELPVSRSDNTYQRSPLLRLQHQFVIR